MFVKITLYIYKTTFDYFIGLILPLLSDKKKFDLIYKTSYWGGVSKDIPKSGLGSSLQATENIRRELPKLLEKYEISTMLDIPCGDFSWLSHLNLPIDKYIGADLVEKLIDENIKMYARQNFEFKCLDLLQDPLPKCDLVMVRDCLVHLTNEQVHMALHNIVRSGSKYLATSHFEDCKENIVSRRPDRWRPLNMTKLPFNLPSPITSVVDSYSRIPYEAHKKLALWQISDLTDFL